MTLAIAIITICGAGAAVVTDRAIIASSVKSNINEIARVAGAGSARDDKLEIQLQELASSVAALTAAQGAHVVKAAHDGAAEHIKIQAANAAAARHDLDTLAGDVKSISTKLDGTREAIDKDARANAANTERILDKLDDIERRQ